MLLGDLPPKSKYTLKCLTEERNTLVSLVVRHCMRDGSVHDFAQAKDYMRSFVCSVFEYLKIDYGKKVHFRTIEDQTAKEALQIILKCWDLVGSRFVKSPVWEPDVRDAIEQHIGHKLPTTNQLDATPTVPVPPDTRRTEAYQKLNTEQRFSPTIRRRLEIFRIRESIRPKTLGYISPNSTSG